MTARAIWLCTMAVELAVILISLGYLMGWGR